MPAQGIGPLGEFSIVPRRILRRDGEKRSRELPKIDYRCRDRDYVGRGGWILLYCPTRRAVRLYHGDAITDYAGNLGSAVNDGVIVTNSGATISSFNGVGFQAIRDGTTNTLLLGERRVNTRDINAGTDFYDNEPAVRPADDCDIVRRAQPIGGSWLGPAFDNDLATTAGVGGYFGGGGLCQFGGPHAEGMMAALCDGSVRLLSYQIDVRVFKNACSRNDRQSVTFE